jgi:SAM-dependent methyltransferase
MDRDPVTEARTLAAAALAAGDATGWFEALYAAAATGDAVVPWDRGGPHPLLLDWARREQPDGVGRRALVVGAGLGDDAELLASLGFATTAFDISRTAVDSARGRHPGSAVDYRQADLLDAPAEWARAFDLVLESLTVQSLPDPPRADAIARVRDLVAPGGMLLVIAFAGEDGGPAAAGPPWPLSRGEVEAFARDGLEAERIEAIADPAQPAERRWRATFRRRRA